ncbi:MAG: exosortase-associated EpsI family protein [Sedimentisphaerales bacterium]|nr:exosortase-associated EpsI family protein [Sedimentisphaerales bacterium]
MNPKLRPYLQPTFVVCVIILAVAALGMDVSLQLTRAFLVKIPIELRKSFELLDIGKLAPYSKLSQTQLDPAMVEELGTSDYLILELEDTQASANSPTRYCRLFMTYYSKADRVPHVPEECYLGAGFVPAESMTVNLHLSHEAEDRDLSIRCLNFERSGLASMRATEKTAVLYFFRVNGHYANDRNEARTILGSNILGKHSFFSKVEWSYYGKMGTATLQPDQEQIVQASEKLISRLLPLLETAHWPDWETINDKKDNRQEGVAEVTK